MARDITWLIAMVVYVLTLIFRVYLHQYRDAQTAQKLGSASWTIGIVIQVLIDSIHWIRLLVQQESVSFCRSVSAAMPALTALSCFSLAMLNGTHGMSFLHKTGVLALMTVDMLIDAWACSGSPNYALELGVSVVSLLLGYATAHALEHVKRRNFLLHEQTSVTSERRGYDIALLHRDMDRLRDDNERLRRAALGPGTSMGGEVSAAPGDAAPAPSSSSSSGPPPTAHFTSAAASSVSSGTSFDREPDPLARTEAEVAALAVKQQACAARRQARLRRRWARARMLFLGLHDPGSILHVLKPELVRRITHHLMDPRPLTSLPPPPPQPPTPPPPSRGGEGQPLHRQP
tara:strand:- start:93 stop:1130 length:1038 start_codon:yes stop_codon:yes gene_type:complete